MSGFSDNARPLYTVGREREIEKLQEYAAKGIHALVLGPAGVGKSHLLRLLQGEKLIRLPGLSPQRQALLSIAEALYERGTLKGDWEPASKDFARLKKQHARTSVQGWVQMVLGVVAKDEWTLVIDDLSDLTMPTGRLLKQLADRFVVFGATRRLKEAHEQFVWKFERLSLSRLSRKETRLLIRQCTAGMEVEDHAFLETHLLKYSAGNPRALLRMVNRLRKEPVITSRVVRRVDLPGGRDQIDITPVILIPVIVLVAARFISLGLEDTEVYMLAGTGAVLAMGVKFFLFWLRR